MNTVNKKHFADQCGVSKAAITKACQNGLIATDENGNVNLNRSITKAYLKAKIEKKNCKLASKATKSRPKKKPGPKTTLEQQPPLSFLELKSLNDLNETNMHLYDKADVDKFKSLESALINKVKREELQGALIRKTVVRQVFGKLYTIDTNQWKSLEDRLAPDICGIFDFEEGCFEETEVRKKITEEVVKTLRFVKRLMDDFLVKNKESAL